MIWSACRNGGIGMALKDAGACGLWLVGACDLLARGLGHITCEQQVCEGLVSGPCVWHKRAG